MTLHYMPETLTLEDYKRDIEGFDEAIKINPQGAKAYLNRGHAYYKLGQYERGREDDAKAEELGGGILWL